MKKIVTIIITIVCNFSFAQPDNSIIAQELYFYRQPSAKIEAMGRTGQTNIDGMFSIYYNPALMSGIDKFTLSTSLSGPYTIFDRSDYKFIGIGTSLIKNTKLGLSTNRMNYGEKFSISDEFGDIISSFEPYLTDYTLSIAIKANRALTFGLNGNLITLNTIKESNEVTESAFSLDVGVHSVVGVSNNHNFRQKTSIGVSVKNFFAQKISDLELPSLLSAGVEFAFLPIIRNPFSFDLKLLLITLNGEYQKDLKSIHTSFNAGGELLISEVLALRCGYYKQQINDQDEEITLAETSYDIYKYINEFTYGFGLRFPLYRFENLEFPVNINFDYTFLPSPKYNNNPDVKFNDFHNYSLTISWINFRDY